MHTSKPKTLASYRHQTPFKAVQLTLTPDNPEGDPSRWRERECFYVSVRDRVANDGSRDRYALALGPFRDHAGATAAVDAVRRKAEELDPRAAFYGYGTCKCLEGSYVGKLNEIMGFNITTGAIQ